MPPFVSVIIPTLNAASVLPACLAALRAQDYPADALEIIVADGGSTDATRALAAEAGARVVENPLRTGEAGKSAGIAAARGDLLAFIDSDNILPAPDWLARMTAPFADPAIVAAEPLRYTRRAADPALTRYFAMLGMNDPLCLFLGNYDRESLVTGRWTDLDIPTTPRAGYLELALTPDRLPTIGANGFIMRRSLLTVVTWQPYFFDIDILCEAIAAGCNRVAKVDCGIVHLYCARLGDFHRKQRRRVMDFLFFRNDTRRRYPWRAATRRAGLARFVLATVTVLPLLAQTWRGWRRCPDPAWRYHLPCCWITLWTYGWAMLGHAVGLKPRPASRDGWRQPSLPA